MKKLFLSSALAVVLMAPATMFSSAAELTLASASANVGQLDPHISTKSQDKVIFGMMFNGLVRFAPGSMSSDSIEPDLAESWEKSVDGLTWTFKIRKGVQFHGGYGELTAEDVVYSLTRAGDPDRSGVSSDYSQVETVTALDDYTVEINFSQSIPSVLGIVANYHGGNIVSKAAAEELGENFKGKPIGTGPFEFQELADGQYVKLKAHETYFRGKPEIDGVTMRYIPSSSARELAFKNGELDLFQGTREDRWIERIQREGTLVDVFQPGELRTLHLNQSIKPFDDPLVRKAIAYALNRDELVAFMGSTIARTNPSPVPGGYLGHSEVVEGLPNNLEKAKSLLTAAGYEDGFTAKVAITQIPALLTPMQVIQAQLKKVGVNVELEVMEHSAWHKAIRDNVSAMVLYGAARFPVADTYLTQFYHSKSTVKTPTAVTNFSHCSVADAQIDGARSEVDPAAQLELWATAQVKIVEDVCSVPLFELQQAWARSPKVNLGFDFNGALSLGPLINEQTTKSE
ncbi:MAG: ABC transporter substrate-binding protein [Lentilitoribacter sp.]